MQEDDQIWLRYCDQLAERARQNGDAAVGSVIIRNNQLVGEGVEASKSKNDITCHAEIEAIRQALNKLEVQDLAGCRMYTTHEPCIMCSYVIRHYRISTVIIKQAVPVIGGASSAYPILTADDIDIWTTPPKVIFVAE